MGNRIAIDGWLPQVHDAYVKLPSGNVRSDRQVREPADPKVEIRLLTAPRRPQGQQGRVHVSSSLPALLTPFIGREQERERAVGLLSRPEVRLLTITGPGGAGKTRLAIAVASQLESSFTAGTYFVPMTTIDDPSLVIPTIGVALNVVERPDIEPHEGLVGAIGDQPVLLVLDCLDQVVSAAPDLTLLLSHCPGLKILVTSRIVLHVHGEQEYPLPPLRMPDRAPGRTWHTPQIDELESYDAVRFFVERARSIQPDFELTSDNALAVVDICQRLDGLPLALELAAARIKTLPPTALVSRLAKRLQVLTGGSRDQPARFQTMRAAIAWSYDLLEEREQALFRRISIFNGGFSLAALEALCGDDAEVLDGISSLIDNSLLMRTTWHDGTPRYALLETIREFGLEQLSERGELEIARVEHAAWCVALVVEAETWLTTVDAGIWLDRMEQEIDNLRAAMAWAVEGGDPDDCVRIITSGYMYWFERGHFRESRAAVERALQAGSDEPTALRSMGFTVAGLLSESLRESERAIAHYNAALAIAAALDLPHLAARATFGLADVADNQERVEEAVALFEAAAPILREAGDWSWLSVTLAGLGVQQHRQGRRDDAEQTFAEALTVARSSGFTWGEASSLYSHGRAARDNGELQRADSMLRESLTLWWRLGDRWRVMRALIDLADVAAEMGFEERAATLLGAAAALHEPIGSPIPASYEASRQHALTRARSNLSERAFSAAWDTGSALSWDAVFAVATTPPADDAPTTVAASGAESITLTAREREVLPLLVAGLTDRQIADALYISHRTAQGHVANIMGKLNVTSRTAAASAALMAGLVTPEM